MAERRVSRFVHFSLEVVDDLTDDKCQKNSHTLRKSCEKGYFLQDEMGDLSY